MNEKKLIAALTNYKTILAILAQLGIIFGVLAPAVDWNVVTVVVTAVLTILVYIGVINKDGMETTKFNK